MEPLVEGRTLVFPVDSNLQRVDPNQRTVRLWIVHPSTQVFGLEQPPTYDEISKRWFYRFAPPPPISPGQYSLWLDGGPNGHVEWSITGVVRKHKGQGVWLENVEGETGEISTASQD